MHDKHNTHERDGCRSWSHSNDCLDRSAPALWLAAAAAADSGCACCSATPAPFNSPPLSHGSCSACRRRCRQRRRWCRCRCRSSRQWGPSMGGVAAPSFFAGSMPVPLLSRSRLCPAHRRHVDFLLQAVRQQGGGAAPDLLGVWPHPLPRDRGDPVAAGAVPHPTGQRRMHRCWRAHGTHCFMHSVSNSWRATATDLHSRKQTGGSVQLVGMFFGDVKALSGDRLWRCRPSARAPTRCWRSSSAASASPMLTG
jgi:hypothetical protein